MPRRAEQAVVVEAPRFEAPEARRRYEPISDYAVIGDCRTAALISRGGSLDWLCVPHFDSPSIFGAILDADAGGRCFVRPTGPARVMRNYVDDSNVLRTTFNCEGGVVRLIDCMTIASESDRRHALQPDHEVLRIIECVSGEVEVEILCDPRMNYGAATPRATRCGKLGWVFEARGQAMMLRSHVALRPREGQPGVRGIEALRAGESRCVSLSISHQIPQVVLPLGDAARRRMETTLGWWHEWSARCTYQGEYRDEIMRSALTLKLLTYAPSGAIIAAPSCSLPECIGGARNWDYRYCWLRDAAMTHRALLDVGYSEEGDAFIDWLLHATALTQPELRVLYNVHGEHHVRERSLDHLEGYKGSRPVRVGNAAKDQLQLDIYGAVTEAVFDFVQAGGELSRHSSKMLVGLGDVACCKWNEPDAGIWEIRCEPRHHTVSKAMCWVTLNRLLRLHEQGHLRAKADAGKFRAAAAQIRSAIESQGYNPEMNSYVDVFHGDRLDASLLLLAMYEYADAGSPRMRATAQRVRDHLSIGRMMLRYRTDEKQDGLTNTEGAFTLCGFWNAQVLAMEGKLDEAVATFEDLTLCANDVGLYSEEVEPDGRVALGNFPQAYTHIGVINAALAIERGGQRRQQTSESHMHQI